MNNENTASQPKAASIGDDAYVKAWMIWLHGPCGTFENKDEAELELGRRNKLYPDPNRKLLELRAPADQAASVAVGVAIKWANGKLELFAGDPKPEAVAYWVSLGATVTPVFTHAIPQQSLAPAAWDYKTLGLPNEEVAAMWRAAGYSGRVPFGFANRIQEKMLQAAVEGQVSAAAPPTDAQFGTLENWLEDYNSGRITQKDFINYLNRRASEGQAQTSAAPSIVQLADACEIYETFSQRGTPEIGMLRAFDYLATKGAKP